MYENKNMCMHLLRLTMLPVVILSFECRTKTPCMPCLKTNYDVWAALKHKDHKLSQFVQIILLYSTEGSPVDQSPPNMKHQFINTLYNIKKKTNNYHNRL